MALRVLEPGEAPQQCGPDLGHCVAKCVVAHARQCTGARLDTTLVCSGRSRGPEPMPEDQMDTSIVRIPLLVAALVAVLAGTASAQAAAPGTDEEKTLYYLGVLAGSSLTRFHLTQDEVAFVQRGIADVLKGETIELDRDKYGQRAQALMQAREQQAAADEKQSSAEFLASEAKKPGVRKLASGMLVEHQKMGTGDSPSVTDTVVVHYHGTLRDGTVFDSSVERKEPFQTQLGRVVRCWQEGVATMREGGKARLVCPPDLAYGDSGAPPKIPGGAALVFEVELIDVVN